MTCVFLVTGSARSRCTPAPRRGRAADPRANTLAGADLLIVGDAPGPGRGPWRSGSSSPTVRVRCYDTRGIHAGWIVQQWSTRAVGVAMDQRATPAMQGRRYLLHRNAAHGAATTTIAMRRDASARALALIDPASETKARSTPACGARRLTAADAWNG